MARITQLKTAPHTRIDNDIIDERAAEMGPFGFTIYVITKRHLNQLTGHCYPSYATIARKSGMDRSTVIRYVKKLKVLNLLSPSLRFREDGSPTSNQYNFHGQECSASSNKTDKIVQIKQDGGTEPPPPSRSEPPDQDVKTKERTIADDHVSEGTKMADQTPHDAHTGQCDSHKSPKAPTQKQLTCPHPPTEIVFMPDNITICHHCYGMLDENLKLIVEDKPNENDCAA